MNLEDLLDESGLRQDEWSLTAPTFGKEGQLTVVGWSGKRVRRKYYILKCSVCSQDTELLGEGYFRSPKNSLVRGQIPCGCATSPQWSKEQYSVLCSRQAVQLGYTFMGFNTHWKGGKTKIKMLCEKHGEWDSGDISHLINGERGCPLCGIASALAASRKQDDILVQSFFASGGFHPDTKFWRSDTKSPNGKRVHWYVYCPECNEKAESQRSNLQEGFRPCACSRSRQQECYINWVVDDSYKVVAIKFGISSASERRIKNQAKHSIYKVIQYAVFKFPDVYSCKKAERDCLQELKCGILTKEEMPDGYTETTSIANLIRVLEIFQDNGCVL